jgi:hypothetical protein
MQPAVGTFIQRSLPQFDVAEQLAVSLLTRAEEAGFGVLESRISLLVSFTHAMLDQSDLPAHHAKDWCNGANIVHGIIDDLVREGLRPVHATLLVVTCK